MRVTASKAIEALTALLSSVSRDCGILLWYDGRPCEDALFVSLPDSLAGDASLLAAMLGMVGVGATLRDFFQRG